MYPSSNWSKAHWRNGPLEAGPASINLPADQATKLRRLTGNHLLGMYQTISNNRQFYQKQETAASADKNTHWAIHRQPKENSRGQLFDNVGLRPSPTHGVKLFQNPWVSAILLAFSEGMVAPSFFEETSHLWFLPSSAIDWGPPILVACGHACSWDDIEM